MPTVNQMSLDQLIQQCVQCLQKTPIHDCTQCRELLRRALALGNDPAWDAFVILLWPFVLRWIYTATPDLAPHDVEILGYRALRQFRSQYAHVPDLAATFPSFAAVIHDLQRCSEQVLE
jgi:hypothetical protein